MKAQLRITGIYDQRTIQLLNENKIYSLGFDLRPRSLNFIQGYRLTEMLGKVQVGEVYLQFQNEKEFIITDIIEKVRSVYSGKLYLEFSDSLDKEFYDQFEIPYLLKFDPYRGALDRCCGKNFMGFNFDYTYLEGIHTRGLFEKWVGEYYRAISFLNKQITHSLNRQWNSDIFPSLYELLDFDYVSLAISNEVEVCFRNVDLKLFKEQVDYIRKHS